MSVEEHMTATASSVKGQSLRERISQKRARKIALGLLPAPKELSGPKFGNRLFRGHTLAPKDRQFRGFSLLPKDQRVDWNVCEEGAIRRHCIQADWKFMLRVKTERWS